MTWPAHALYSLAEIKRVVPNIASTIDKEALLADIASWVVDDIEGFLDRRIVYRAPTEDDDAIYTGSYTAGSPAVAGQPASPGRTLVLTFPANTTGGTVTVTGTVAGVAGTARVFDAANGTTQYGLDFFTAVSGITIASPNPATGTVKIGTSLGYVEYHTPEIEVSTTDLALIEYPAYQMAAVYEDAYRSYGSTTLLASTDYLLSERSRLVRLSSGLLTSWQDGYRAVKLVYSAGYFGSWNVPATIKRVALRLGVTYYQEAVKGQVEVASGTNPMGTWTRTGQAGLTKEMQFALASEQRYIRSTGERDFDLEAA